jgi:uncharacterized membrane protein
MLAIHILEIELGAAFLSFWVLSIVALWFLADRPGRRGLVRSAAVIEGMMLVSILTLLLGVTFSIWGSGLAD